MTVVEIPCFGKVVVRCAVMLGYLMSTALHIHGTCREKDLQSHISCLTIISRTKASGLPCRDLRTSQLFGSEARAHRSFLLDDNEFPIVIYPRKFVMSFYGPIFHIADSSRNHQFSLLQSEDLRHNNRITFRRVMRSTWFWTSRP